MQTTHFSIDAARSAIQERSTTALALAEKHYARIQKDDGQIGAYLTLCKERALEQADRIDRMAAEGKPLPPLGGVPVAIKDVMSTRGVRTTAGSKSLGHYIPPYDCTAVARTFSERPTATSLPWARRMRTRHLARCAILVTWAACREDLRAVRRRRSQRTWLWSLSGRIREARSGNRPRSAA